MNYLAGSNLLNSSQIVNSYQHLAALGAALLFLAEGAVLFLLVFSSKRSSPKNGLKSRKQ